MLPAATIYFLLIEQCWKIETHSAADSCNEAISFVLSFEALVHSCIEGPYDTVCGDREKTRGTYRFGQHNTKLAASHQAGKSFYHSTLDCREFVLFDSEDVYVEYVQFSVAIFIHIPILCILKSVDSECSQSIRKPSVEHNNLLHILAQQDQC